MFSIHPPLPRSGHGGAIYVRKDDLCFLQKNGRWWWFQLYICICFTQKFPNEKLGGENSNVKFSSRNLGDDPRLTQIFFRWLGSTTLKT